MEIGSGRKVHTKENKQDKMKKLLKLSREELFNKARGWKIANVKLRNMIDRERYKVRTIRLRLLKIRDSIDFLLTHPYSRDTSNKTPHHLRDHTVRLSQLKSAKHK